MFVLRKKYTFSGMIILYFCHNLAIRVSIISSTYSMNLRKALTLYEAVWCSINAVDFILEVPSLSYSWCISYSEYFVVFLSPGSAWDSMP